MPEPSNRALRMTLSLIAGELILAGIGIGIAWLFLGDPLPFTLGWGPLAFVHGIAAALPPMALVWLVWWDGGRRLPGLWTHFDRMVERLAPVLGPMLRGLGGWGILLVALAAGIGEEILFRGALQPLLGLVLAGIIFGVLHALTPGYFVFATVFGLYLGWLYEVSGDLTVPILAHAVYDVFAFYLLRRVSAERASAPSAPGTAAEGTGPTS